MQNKWKKGQKINRSLRLKSGAISKLSPGVINKIIPLKKNRWRKRNKKKRTKEKRKRIKVMERRKNNSVKAIR
jgi:hypothetical protein